MPGSRVGETEVGDVEVDALANGPGAARDNVLFELKKLLTLLILPPAGPLLVSAAGLALLRRRPLLGRVLAWGGVFTLTLLSLPIVSYVLGKPLETGPPLDLRRAQDAQAIVVIAGGVRRNAPEYGGQTLNWLSLDRVRYGAWLARKTGLPVLVSGGGGEGMTEAALMSATLEAEFGIGVRWVESRSRNTRENARYSAELLHADGVHRVLLVTHAFDMRRAAIQFRDAGLDVIVAATGFRGQPDFNVREVLPSASAFVGSYYALYEWLALVAHTLGLN